MKNYIYKRYDWLDRANEKGVYSGQELGKYIIEKVNGELYYRVITANYIGDTVYLNKDEIKLLFEKIDGKPIEDSFLDAL